MKTDHLGNLEELVDPDGCIRHSHDACPPHVRAEPNDAVANVRDVHFEITHTAHSTSEQHIRKSLCSAALSSATFFVLFLLHVDWVHCSSHSKK